MSKKPLVSVVQFSLFIVFGLDVIIHVLISRKSLNYKLYHIRPNNLNIKKKIQLFYGQKREVKMIREFLHFYLHILDLLCVQYDRVIPKRNFATLRPAKSTHSSFMQISERVLNKRVRYTFAEYHNNIFFYSTRRVSVTIHALHNVT